MSAKSLRLSFVCVALAGALVACGKKETPPEEAVDKAATEESAAVTKEEPDATSEEHADVAGKDDLADLGKQRRDRLTNRRPPPRGREPDAGESPDADKVAVEPRELKDLKDSKDLKDVKDLKVGSDLKEPKVEGNPSAGALDVKPVPADGVPSDPTANPTLGGEPAAGLPGEHKAGVAPSPRELAPHPTTSPQLDAMRLMPLASVLELTQSKGLTDAGVLPGIATGPGYVSILYKSTAADKFGVSLQAWQDPARRESDDRFRRMRLQYPNAEDVQVLQPAKAFFAHFSGIQMLTFVDSVKRIVATVACAESICTHEQLTKLAKAVRERL